MRYHFRVLPADGGRFVVQSIEFFHCANSVGRLNEAEQEATRLLHKYLSHPSFDMYYSAPREGTLSEIESQYGYRAVRVFSVNVDPVTAFATTLRRLRSVRCLSQSDAAKLLGIKSRSAYQRLEDPLRANPTLKTISRIATLYPNLNVGSLFEPTSPQPARASHRHDRNH